LDEAARAVAAPPQVQVAADARREPATQVVAQHCMPERTLDEPRPAAPAAAHRLRGIAPVPRVEPLMPDLPGDRRIAENRAISAACNAEWRQAFAGVEPD